MITLHILLVEYKIIVTVSRTVPVIYADLLLSWPQVQVWAGIFLSHWGGILWSVDLNKYWRILLISTKWFKYRSTREKIFLIKPWFLVKSRQQSLRKGGRKDRWHRVEAENAIVTWALLDITLSISQ